MPYNVMFLHMPVGRPYKINPKQNHDSISFGSTGALIQSGYMTCVLEKHGDTCCDSVHTNGKQTRFRMGVDWKAAAENTQNNHWKLHAEHK